MATTQIPITIKATEIATNIIKKIVSKSFCVCIDSSFLFLPFLIFSFTLSPPLMKRFDDLN